MPQLMLPVFPAEVTPINEEVAFQRRDGRVVYFHGLLPVFQHDAGDVRSFRLFSSQLIVNQAVRPLEISRTFQVPLATVKRYLRVYREQGAEGFFRTPRRRSGTVLNAEVKQKAQDLLDAGQSVPAVSRQIGVRGNTLHKAIRAGRLHAAKKKT